MKIKKYTEFLNEDVDIDDLSVGEIGSLHVWDWKKIDDELTKNPNNISNYNNIILRTLANFETDSKYGVPSWFIDKWEYLLEIKNYL